MRAKRRLKSRFDATLSVGGCMVFRGEYDRRPDQASLAQASLDLSIASLTSARGLGVCKAVAFEVRRSPITSLHRPRTIGELSSCAWDTRCFPSLLGVGVARGCDPATFEHLMSWICMNRHHLNHRGPIRRRRLPVLAGRQKHYRAGGRPQWDANSIT
jgi:hypothetical protein